MDREFWEPIVIFVAGMLSLPAFYLLAITFEWLFSRNMELECGKCGRKFGSIYRTPRTLNIVTNAQYRWHIVSGQCKRNANNG